MGSDHEDGDAGNVNGKPAQTVKVCMPKGGERDPQRMEGHDSSCQMTDVKTLGNKTSWKAKCVNNGETMNGAGEDVDWSRQPHCCMLVKKFSEGHFDDERECATP